MGKRTKSQSKPKSKDKRQPKQQEQLQPRPQVHDKKSLLSMKTPQQMSKMKEYYNLILIDPESNFKHTDNIFVFTKAQSVQTATTALRLLAEVFVNTVPLEAVDLKKNEDRKQITVTKDQFKVIRFEEMLVSQYERYLKNLAELNTKLRSTDFQSDKQLFQEFKKCILHCLIKCFKALWHFNHFKLLADLMIKFIHFEQTRNALSNFLADKNSATLPAKAKIINSIASLIKEKPQKFLPDDLIKVVNCTHIDSRYLQKDVQAVNFKKKKLKRKLYRQKELQKKKDKERVRQAKQAKQAGSGTLERKKIIKQQKQKQKMKVREEVNKQFAQGQASLPSKQLIKGNSAILQQIFYIYFKILVEHIDSKFTRDCLDGTLAFAHLISIDLTANLIKYLDSAGHTLRDMWLIKKNPIVLQNRLLLVFTAESLLNGPLSVYSMDDHKATTSLFKIMRDINHSKITVNNELSRLIAITLEEALIKKRQLSQEVVGSLLKQLSFYLLREEVPKAYFLEFIRQVASKYNRVGKMFEDDNEGYGINSFNSHIEDPQSTNAINTQIISNLRMIAKKFYTHKQTISRFQRQNFTRPENCPMLEELLLSDLTKAYKKNE